MILNGMWRFEKRWS